MPSRVVPFVNGEYYHVFNRGVAAMPIYRNARDYGRFMRTMLYYQIEGPKPRLSLFKPTKVFLKNKKIVDVICYCFMPNHFHFLIRQKKDGGITEFVSKISNSYTKYFNTKNQRYGPLLQGEFKAVHIDTNEQLIHVSRYIHLNPIVGFVTSDLSTYKWSSFPEYEGEANASICAKEIILDQFPSMEDYKQFVLDQEDYARKLEIIKHQLLDFEG